MINYKPIIRKITNRITVANHLQRMDSAANISFFGVLAAVKKKNCFFPINYESNGLR